MDWLELKDVVYIVGGSLSIITSTTILLGKLRAAEKEHDKWRTNTDRDIAALRERLDRGDRQLSRLATRDDDILKALNDLRVGQARLEEKIDRNGATG